MDIHLKFLNKYNTKQAHVFYLNSGTNHNENNLFVHNIFEQFTKNKLLVYSAKADYFIWFKLKTMPLAVFSQYCTMHRIKKTFRKINNYKQPNQRPFSP